MGKYHFNENCFNQISADSLYWLGFLYADGCIHKQKYSNSYVTTLSLASKDKEILEKFKLFLETDSPITLSPNKYSGSYAIRIHNKNINKSLLALGLLPRKSLIIGFPEFLKNHPLVSHFIRGYFDGDGCICEKFHKNKSWLHFTIVGTENMMQEIQNIFYNRLNILPRKLIRQGKVWSLHIGKIEYIKKVKSFLYDNAKYFLLRKKEKFNNHSELKFGTTSKYKRICHRAKTNRWRASYYDNGKRLEKQFPTEQEAKNFLDKLI